MKSLETWKTQTLTKQVLAQIESLSIDNKQETSPHEGVAIFPGDAFEALADSPLLSLHSAFPPTPPAATEPPSLVDPPVFDLARDQEINVALVDRPMETLSLLSETQPQFAELLRNCLGHKWDDFVMLLAVPREELCDLEWMRQIAFFLNCNPALLATFKELVGYDHIEEPITPKEPAETLARMNSVKSSATNPRRDRRPSMSQYSSSLRSKPYSPAFSPSAQFSSSPSTFSNIHVQLRDENETAAKLETQHPLFFNLVKEYFDKKCNDPSLYVKFLDILSAPRCFLSDSEWLNYISETFLQNNPRLRQMFRDIVGAVYPSSCEIVESGDELDPCAEQEEADDELDGFFIPGRRGSLHRTNSRLSRSSSIIAPSSVTAVCSDDNQPTENILEPSELEALIEYKSKLSERDFVNLVEQFVSWKQKNTGQPIQDIKSLLDSFTHQQSHVDA